MLEQRSRPTNMSFNQAIKQTDNQDKFHVNSKKVNIKRKEKLR